MVRGAGIEPARLIQPRDFKSLVSTYSTTCADVCQFYKPSLLFIKLKGGMKEASWRTESFVSVRMEAEINSNVEARTGVAPVYAVLQTAA